MIISHKHRFIFIHIQKCAGTSIAHALLPLLGPDDVVLGYTPEGEALSRKGQTEGLLHKHSKAIHIKEVLGDEIWNSYFKFSFVRNPWDMLVSTYHWRLITPWDDDKNTGEKIKSLIDFEHYLLSSYRRRKGCLEFVSDEQGKPLLDFIGKSEQLRWDFYEVCRRTGLPSLELSRKNTSHHNYYPDYYNPLTRELVGEWFKRDIETFDYHFGDPEDSNLPEPCYFRPKPRRLIVHCSHHRAGTVWFGRILRDISAEFGWKFQAGNNDLPDPDTDIYLHHHSRVEFSRLPPYTGTHITRDPRDIIASGYHYHLWCKEKWCLHPRQDFNGRSFQEELNSLSIEDGISLEMNGSLSLGRKSINTMIAFQQTNILEVRFEALIQKETTGFEKIFQHYDLDDEEMERAMAVVERYSFHKMTGRKRGQQHAENHFRRGVAGDWKNCFSQKNKEQFKQLYPGVLVTLGYEPDENW